MTTSSSAPKVHVAFGVISASGVRSGYEKLADSPDDAATLIAVFKREVEAIGGRLGYVRIDGVQVELEFSA